MLSYLLRCRTPKKLSFTFGLLAIVSLVSTLLLCFRFNNKHGKAIFNLNSFRQTEKAANQSDLSQLPSAEFYIQVLGTKSPRRGDQFDPQISETELRATLKLLWQFLDLCEKHSIPAMLYGGTLLGSYRHHGFIPWDDDLDLLLSKADKGKLRKALNEMFLQLLLLILLAPNASLSTTSLSGYKLLEKLPRPDCPSSTPPAEVASVHAAFDNLAACALACTVASNRWCFGFYMAQSKSCRLVRFDAFVNTWLGTPLCPESMHVLPMPETVQISSVGCQQSSSYLGGVCERAIDGNKNQLFSGKSCSHTMNAAYQWFEARFPTPVFVSYVTIYNRHDCCVTRLSKISLRMDDVECYRVDIGGAFSVANFTCNAFGSRFGVFSMQSQAVNLCEIEFFGH